MSMPFREDFDDDPTPAWGRAPAARSRWLRAIFRQGDNPLTWAIPLGRVGGISVRLSLLYIVFVLVQLVTAIGLGTIQTQAMMSGSLFVLVLMHEFGHCLACRRVGGLADEILMWPLGGLASCRPPHDWRADLITTVGGPAVNALLMPVLAGVILLTGGTLDALIFNPFNYQAAWATYAESWWKSWLWLTYLVNWILLAFNVLVPAFPLDGGRVMQALLWRTMGHRRSMQIATLIALFAAGVLGVLGMATRDFNLLGIAIFVGVYSHAERQRLRFTEGPGGVPDEPDETPYAGSLRLVRDSETEAGPSRAELKAKKQRDAEAAQAAAEAQELDRILEKIAKSGRDSLSAGEQRFLTRATNKRRLQ